MQRAAPSASWKAYWRKSSGTRQRDKALVSYYRSMMGQKDKAYSQTKVCQLAVEYLFRKGFTEI